MSDIKVAVVFGDGRVQRNGAITKATRERLAHLIGLLKPESITHVVLAGSETTTIAGRGATRIVSEAFLMRQHLLRHVTDRRGWFSRIILDETVGLANSVREVLTILNQKELTRAPVMVIAQKMRLTRLAVHFRGHGWTEEHIDYRECPTRWETEKPCAQTILLIGAMVSPLGGAIASIRSACRHRLLTQAAPPPDIGI